MLNFLCFGIVSCFVFLNCSSHQVIVREKNKIGESECDEPGGCPYYPLVSCAVGEKMCYKGQYYMCEKVTGYCVCKVESYESPKCKKDDCGTETKTRKVCDLLDVEIEPGYASDDISMADLKEACKCEVKWFESGDVQGSIWVYSEFDDPKCEKTQPIND